MKRIVSAIQKRGTGNEGVITVYETKCALPANWPEHLDGFEKDLRLVLEENHLDPKAHIGVDKIDGQLMVEMTKRGFTFGDGEEIMCAAREVKTEVEIQIMMQAAAAELHRLGSQWIHNIQMTSGTRAHPHPHPSSDRVIQPGDEERLIHVAGVSAHGCCADCMRQLWRES